MLYSSLYWRYCIRQLSNLHILLKHLFHYIISPHTLQKVPWHHLAVVSWLTYSTVTQMGLAILPAIIPATQNPDTLIMLM